MNNIMRVLDFKLPVNKDILIANFTLNEIDGHILIYQMSDIWYIDINYKNKSYEEKHKTLYEALDAANDWWFHAQRGMLDEK